MALVELLLEADELLDSDEPGGADGLAEDEGFDDELDSAEWVELLVLPWTVAVEVLLVEV